MLIKFSKVFTNPKLLRKGEESFSLEYVNSDEISQKDVVISIKENI